jgi:hypothetical protein
MEQADGGRFAQGATVVRRDVFRDRVWSATPFRAIRDTGSELLLACWPGVEMLAPTTWTAWLRSGEDAVRKQAISNLAAGRWDLETWPWRDTTLLVRYELAAYFSVSRFFDSDEHCGGWYVDFICPYVRTSIGIDTFDLLVDLVVEADLSGYRWKDEDEYAQGRRLGLIDDTLHASVDSARQLVVALIESRSGPFSDDQSMWRRDPCWPMPALPPDVLTLHR